MFRKMTVKEALIVERRKNEELQAKLAEYRVQIEDLTTAAIELAGIIADGEEA